ncbi:methyl-accepting chemotaxis protein [Petralouisia muris]|uniref:Methyl-accepting chemotaxis protein n=1 Tax=Petralouisia muris TaxID=3032872 RepID=A0AC61RVS9_9FIRM|nr:methyl-accepting chemotaxis protein [Petralouisia muris]
MKTAIIKRKKEDTLVKANNFPTTEKSADSTGSRKLSSIKIKIVGVLLISIIVTIFLSTCIIIPNVKKNITATTQNYMSDFTDSYGKVLDQNLKVSIMYLSTERLETMLSGAGLKNITSSYFYVTGADGTILYHPDGEKIGQTTGIDAITALTEQLEQENTPTADIIRYTYNGKGRYASYYIVDKGKAILILTADENEILGPVTNVVRQALLCCGILLVILGIFGYLLIARMMQPIITISEIIRKFAAMDLTEDHRLEKISKHKDETGTIGTALISLREAFAAIITDIKQQSSLLYATSESLTSNASATFGTVQNVERAVNEIAAGAANQAEETQKATDDILLIGTMVENTSSEVSSLRSIAQSIKDSSEHANTTLRELDTVNKQAMDSINIIYEQTHTTNESALKIKEATTLISSIADETNLLSLNASIEAARAGDAGKGFAVVASEIQKLAEQSNKSAQQIDSIIYTLMEDSRKAVETMEAVKEIMAQQNENVTKTGTTFSQVQGGIMDSAVNVDSIAERTNQLNSARTNIVDVVQNLTSIAEQNAANTQETSAAVMEVANVMQEISNHASELQNIASSLETNVNTFQL